MGHHLWHTIEENGVAPLLLFHPPPHPHHPPPPPFPLHFLFLPPPPFPPPLHPSPLSVCLCHSKQDFHVGASPIFEWDGYLDPCEHQHSSQRAYRGVESTDPCLFYLDLKLLLFEGSLDACANDHVYPQQS